MPDVHNISVILPGYGSCVPGKDESVDLSSTRQPGSQPPTGWGEWGFLLAALSLAAVLVAIELRAPMKDDVAWLLFVAERWLAGDDIAVTLVEINPPPVIWISSIPVLLARLLPWTELQIMPVMVAAIMAGASAWCAAVAAGQLAVPPSRLFAALLLVLLVVAAGEFGQREHLIIALALPYLALRLRAGARVATWQHLLAGALVGLACCMKPYYAGAFVLVELACVLRGEGWRLAAILSAIGTGLLVAAAVLVWHPGYLSETLVLARVLYTPLRNPVLLRTGGSWLLLAGLLFTGWTYLARLRQAPEAAPVLLLLAFALGGTYAFQAQGMGWFYHRLPATAALCAALLCCLALPRPLLARPWRLACAGLLVCFAVQAGTRLVPRSAQALAPETAREMQLAALLRQQGAASYMAFSGTLGFGFPVVQLADVRWGSRFASMWALRGALALEARDEAAGITSQVRHWIAADFLRACPDVVVLDLADGLDYPALIAAADSGFAAAWAGYRAVSAPAGMQAFRRPAAACDSAASLPPGVLRP